MAESLGRLEKVELRNHWPREDKDFTPWLAEEENISLLGETIGIEIEVQEQEASIGPFKADILCKNLADNSIVIIENQLEKTNHSHLGQLLTYAAGRDAESLIWIVEKFTEEHRASLDWLNRVTDDGINFFGIEMELWKIGDSIPAPKFNLVVKPNDWVKKVKESTEASFSRLSAGQQLQVDFWGSFGDFLSSNQAAFRPPKPYPSNWMGYGIGHAGAGLIVVFNRTESIVRIEINNNEHPGWFHLLHQQKEQIEIEIGFPLYWDDRPDNKFSFIQASTEFDATNRDEWPTIYAWMLERMKAFRNILGPKIKTLNDEDWQPEEVEE